MFQLSNRGHVAPEGEIYECSGLREKNTHQLFVWWWWRSSCVQLPTHRNVCLAFISFSARLLSEGSSFQPFQLLSILCAISVILPLWHGFCEEYKNLGDDKRALFQFVILTPSIHLGLHPSRKASHCSNLTIVNALTYVNAYTLTLIII